MNSDQLRLEMNQAELRAQLEMRELAAKLARDKVQITQVTEYLERGEYAALALLAGGLELQPLQLQIRAGLLLCPGFVRSAGQL